MQGPTFRSVALTVLSFLVVTFAVQATSHFVINTGHYAAIPIMRAEPIMALGILVMLIQGTVAGLLYPAVRLKASGIKRGVIFGWLLGAFLASYIVLTEPAKYEVPSISAWMWVEGLASFVQFTLFGVLLAVVHRRSEHEDNGAH